MAEEPVLRTSGLRFGFAKDAAFLGPIDVEVAAGTMLVIVGPNGAGKSTLLRLMAGLLAPRSGSVRVAGLPIGAMGHRRRARTIAFLPQHAGAPQDATACEVVLLGRFPHRRHRFFDSAEDHRIAAEAMRTTRALAFAERRLDTLSAGEQQRVHLAAALAQEPRLLLLDEPTSALDPYYRLDVFGTLERLCRDLNRAVVVVTHDLNLAARYADSILLLNHGQVMASGAPDRVLRAEILEQVYGVAFETCPSASGGPAWVLPVARSSVASS